MSITPSDHDPLGDSEPKPQFKGVWIPASVWENPAITWTEKCLLAEIDCLSRNGNCFASNAYLAKKMGMTQGSIANMMSKLTKAKLITHASFNGRVRQIYVAQNAQANPQLSLHKEMIQGSSGSEGRVHQEVNIVTRGEKKREKKFSARLEPRALRSSNQVCPSIEAAVQVVEDTALLDASHVLMIAEKWYQEFCLTPMRDWKQHLEAFAKKYENDKNRTTY